MNKSIAINTPALCFPSPLTSESKTKRWGKRYPVSVLRCGVFSLALLRHPPVCLPLTLSSASFWCVSGVCVCVCARAYLRPLSLFREPGGFGPTPRSLNALWHGEALRTDTRYPTPPLFFFFFLTPPPPSSLDPLAPTHSHHIHKHKQNPTL